ncbi:MAG: hypothetical protein LOD94_16585 [Gammaproteobacteria bacterium]
MRLCTRLVSFLVASAVLETASFAQEGKSQEPPVCRAAVGIEYLQRNTVASVAGVIDNDDCAASSGTFVIVLSVRRESGELVTIEVPQAWQRDDDRPVTFSGDYEIGENVELVRARVQKVTCRCGVRDTGE